VAKTTGRLKQFDFLAETRAGAIVCTGGFEDRSVAFVAKLRKARCSVEKSMLLQYEGQIEENEPNNRFLKRRLKTIIGKEPQLVSINADKPIGSLGRITRKIEDLLSRLSDRTVFVDVSGMTHLLAIGTIHACVSSGLRTFVVYTEAKSYFPQKRDQQKLIRAWKDEKYDIAVQYLQSAGLKAVQIIPAFAGNFRPGRQTCLMVFVGFEPNRIETLVDDYAPGVLIVFYGRSPHKEFRWRTRLSRELHNELFSQWYVRQTEISTLEVEDILRKLEREFQVVKEQFDVAIAPQCSKLQALASYLFWRRHPEVQLIFTSPVSFNPKRYSRGARRTFVYEIS